MTTRRIVRAGLVALLVGYCVLEALAWARIGAIDVVHGSFPRPAITRDGKPIFLEWIRAYQGGKRVGLRVWDADGVELGSGDVTDSNFPFARQFARWRVGDMYGRRRIGGVDKHAEHPAFLPGIPPDRDASREIARDLERWSQRYRGRFIADPAPFDASWRPQTRWRFESGRFVARDADGSVQLSVGPEGTAKSSDAPAGLAFGPLVQVSNERRDVRDADAVVHHLLDLESSRLVRLAWRAADNAVGVDVDVRTIPLRSAEPGTKRQRPTAVVLPGRIVVVELDGTLWVDERIGPDEGPVTTGVSSYRYDANVAPADASWEFAASSPIDLRDPLVSGTRLRHQSPGQPMTTRDVVWRPVGAVQRAYEALACVPAVLRPLPLTAASFLSAPPSDGDGGSSWWWRDPVLAGKRRPIALVANVLLGALCAFLAWRIGRVHCGTTRAARAVALTGLLLGPLGLLLIRILVVRAPAEKVGPGKRSLLLDTCPATDTPWPEPVRTGREIFEGA